uniref:Putative secreted protein n=1 Tax=Anopheles darlingi TaxID=43151 RepID=A0A2M4DGY0_ANODA
MLAPPPITIVLFSFWAFGCKVSGSPFPFSTPFPLPHRPCDPLQRKKGIRLQGGSEVSESQVVSYPSWDDILTNTGNT